MKDNTQNNNPTQMDGYKYAITELREKCLSISWNIGVVMLNLGKFDCTLGGYGIISDVHIAGNMLVGNYKVSFRGNEISTTSYPFRLYVDCTNITRPDVIGKLSDINILDLLVDTSNNTMFINTFFGKELHISFDRSNDLSMFYALYNILNYVYEALSSKLEMEIINDDKAHGYDDEDDD